MESKRTYNWTVIAISLSIIILGLTFILISIWIETDSIKNNELDPSVSIFLPRALNTIGVSFLVIGTISVFREFLLRQAINRYTEEILQNIYNKEKESVFKFAHEEKKKLIESLDEARNETITSIKKTIVDAMPPKYTHIREAGIVDVFESLDIKKLQKKIKKLRNDEFRILKMWIPNLNVIEHNIIDAINHRDCKIKIALQNPAKLEVIKKRAATLRYFEERDILNELRKNQEQLYSIWERLSDDKKDNLMVKYFDTFVSVSLWGYGNNYIMGLYLNKRLSGQGVQIKANGTTHYLYNSLKEHFDEIWGNSSPMDLKSFKLNEDNQHPKT